MGITHQKGLGTIVYKTAHVRFHGRKWVHTRLSEKDRTQRLTRRNSGVSDGGWYHYPRSVSHGSETLRGRVSERRTLPLWDLGREVLSKSAESFRDSDAHDACRCPEGVAAPLGCVIFLLLSKLWLVHPALRAFCACEAWVVSLPSDCFTRFGNPAWPGGRTAYFAAFGSWPGVLPKNAESLRDSDAHDARRCPEASRPRWAT